MSDVVIFFSGSAAVPPTGFPLRPSVTFIHDSGRKFCTANMCDLILRLPTSHGENYNAFREALIMSLKGHDGFGEP